MDAQPEQKALILKTDRLGRVIIPKAQREALLDEFAKSGMSGQAFAAWAGVKYQTFATWVQKRRRQQRSESGTESEPLTWAEAVIQEVPEQATSISLVIEMPGATRMRCT